MIKKDEIQLGNIYNKIILGEMSRIIPPIIVENLDEYEICIF